MTATRHCFEAELRQGPQLAGRIVVEVTLKQDGSVDARVVEDGLGHPALAACIVRTVGGLHIPNRSGGDVMFRVPLVFATP